MRCIMNPELEAKPNVDNTANYAAIERTEKGGSRGYLIFLKDALNAEKYALFDDNSASAAPAAGAALAAIS